MLPRLAHDGASPHAVLPDGATARVRTAVSDVKHPAIRQYHPATFLERGVAIPFTTPLLYGTRARPGEHHGADLIIPNPSGGRGVYIMSWSGMAQLCTPTLHDRIFNEQIALLGAITPASIRRVARIIALEGLAGEQAMEAADAAMKAETNERTVTNFQLLMRLVEQAAASNSPPFVSRGPLAPDAARRAQLAVDWAARCTGRPVNWVANALEQLADVITPVGIGGYDTRARLPRLLSTLREVRRDIDFWSSTQVEEDLTAHCQVIRTLADLTLSLGDNILQQAQKLTADVVALLCRWANEHDMVAEEATRPAWLLDGWD
ncbi:MAG: hypothetical protein ACJ8AW_13690 [Rhodopila sp.]